MTYIPNRSAKLDWARVREIRHRYENEGWSQGRIAREYGMSSAQVGRVVRYESWLDHHATPASPTDNPEGSLSLVQKLLDEANQMKQRDKELEELKK